MRYGHSNLCANAPWTRLCRTPPTCNPAVSLLPPSLRRGDKNADSGRRPGEATHSSHFDKDSARHHERRCRNAHSGYAFIEGIGSD